jgi:hypothetical protein
MQWRHIKFEDIPSREEFEQLTLDLLRQANEFGSYKR